MPNIYINVHFKDEILDPQGRTILGALLKQGLNGLNEVRQGKQFLLKFENDLTAEQFSEIQRLAKELLSNPVIEVFSIEVKDEA